ncbi:TPA: DUF512 domain-containing protein [Clostridium botulinum]|uniref:DUF512 domain-containing protein n=1 Tax=Clostridium botulinum TaxID=1491 RepID=UPI0029A4D5E5|nr:DUF512 domain-containing protein [Clostridium botulinum]HDK7180532.1 DUF512 domain-containing protein [Clostridium botulinum]HDK7191553.1 DUF512 domain-containing protein [Clostridium botulinum]HDK7217966.1 DUF512 domain-containing protein [Clostridium botulinum]HDK7226078.1 DUF512 domain-containing protein [Clostridium botulinum]
MKKEILKVERGSIAEELEIEEGDFLLSINNKEVKDIIDYKFLVCDEYLEVEIEKNNGEIWELEIEKDYDEDLGIEFKAAILDAPQRCHNNCLFCFIDQLPKGMRETLYFKDDDSRLSFLQGNFLTLTNMKDEDIDRIINYKISPINISVHTTNPELRVKLLNNRFAGNLYDRMKKLAQGGIKMDCQVVLCPGLNNGEELKRTIEDLYALYPQVENLAVVPIGVTKFREGLYQFELFNKETANKELDMVEEYQNKFIKEIGKPFVRLSDEFYVIAEREVPKEDFYDGFKQLEDGVGVIRIFRNNIKDNVNKLSAKAKGSFSLITGQSAYKEVIEASKMINNHSNDIDIEVIKIDNNFFGKTITVAGLITAKDIIEQTQKKNLGKYVIIPDVMLRKGYELADISEQVFLDDVTLKELSNSLKREILVCDYTGEDLIDIINEHSKEE